MCSSDLFPSHDMFAFVQDSSNRDEAISLGLIDPPPKVEPPAPPAPAGAV